MKNNVVRPIPDQNRRRRMVTLRHGHACPPTLIDPCRVFRPRQAPEAIRDRQRKREQRPAASRFIKSRRRLRPNPTEARFCGTAVKLLMPFASPLPFPGQGFPLCPVFGRERVVSAVAALRSPRCWRCAASAPEFQPEGRTALPQYLRPGQNLAA